jgi:hypothetical protein
MGFYRVIFTSTYQKTVTKTTDPIIYLNRYFMEQKNYEYLCGSLDKLGFAGVFEKALKAALQMEKKQFELKSQMSNGGRELNFVFKFEQREEGAFHFLNNVVATSKKADQPEVTHDFFLYRQQGYNLREMVNMLDGRSVHTEFRRDGRNVELWRRIDFSAKDERGNNLLRTTYVNSNKFNLNTELVKLPIQGLSAEDKQLLISSLKSGDMVSVVVKQGNNREKVDLVALPHLGVIGAYNAQGERISLQNNMMKVVMPDEQPALSESTRQMVNATAHDKEQTKDQTPQAKVKVS